MHRAISLRMTVRLALLHWGGAQGALLFETPANKDIPLAPGGSNALTLTSDGAAEVVASQIDDLSNTLLASAVKHQQARFIRDCGHYMQVRAAARTPLEAAAVPGTAAPGARPGPPRPPAAASVSNPRRPPPADLRPPRARHLHSVI
jgi:hypothetical protein